MIIWIHHEVSELFTYLKIIVLSIADEVVENKVYMFSSSLNQQQAIFKIWMWLVANFRFDKSPQ